jgi:hypothetical protein
VLDSGQDGSDNVSSLAVQTAQGPPAVFVVNQEFQPIDLHLNLTGADASSYPTLVVTATDRTHQNEVLGRLTLQDGMGELTLAPRSITTLFPAGTEDQPVSTS